MANLTVAAGDFIPGELGPSVMDAKTEQFVGNPRLDAAVHGVGEVLAMGPRPRLAAADEAQYG